MAKLQEDVFVLEHWATNELRSKVVGIYNSVDALNIGYQKALKRQSMTMNWYACNVPINSYSPYGVVECSGVKYLHIDNAGVFAV